MLISLLLYQAAARQHEVKLSELSENAREQQASIGRTKSEAQANAAQFQALQLKAKRSQAEVNVSIEDPSGTFVILGIAVVGAPGGETSSGLEVDCCD